jgi:pimeloyl-ACP methyl ester carboxylesterase
VNRLFGGFAVVLFAATNGHVTVGGGRLYYEVEGKGCPIVLIAGGGGMDLRQWDGEFTAFAAGHRTVRFDPRGVGRSDTPNAPYSNVADLRALLDALSIEKAVLVGVSSGGGIALDFAIVHPERVSGLVLSAPLVRGFEMSEDQKKRVAGFAQASQKSVAEGVRAFLDDPYFVPAPGNPEARRLAEKLMTENARDIPAGLARELEPPTVSRLGEVRAPTLLLVGALDHPDLHRRVEFLTHAIPGSTKRTIPGAGHMLNLEKPREFGAATLDVVSRRICP